MNSSLRNTAVAAVIAAGLFATPARAADAALPLAAAGPSQPPPDIGAVLTLADAQRLAVEHQPLLQAQADRADAARQRAVAARQLPDPQLKLGILDVPADTRDAGSFNRDSFTMTQVGVMQEFPLAGKRALRGEAESLKAAASDALLAAATRAVRRDAGMAYLDVLHPHHAIQLVRAQIAEAQRAYEAAKIGYRTGSRNQADVLAAQAAIGMLRDKAADFDQQYAVAQENLRRWTGSDADFTPREPADPVLPALAALLVNLSRHPELIAADRGVDRAEVDMRLARKSRQPDFNVEVDYAYRRDFSDFVSLQVGIPLPIFAHDRQDREIAAARSELDSEQALREDLRRRLQAEVSGIYRQWQVLGTRIDNYQSAVLPPLAARSDTALAEYRAGTGSFDAVLNARQATLDAQLSLLELRLQRLRAALELRYFAPET